MKYEKTNEGFIKKFIDKKTNYVEGDKLYSYSMLIADRKKKSIYHTKYSMTTSQHIGKVKSLSDYKVINTIAFHNGLSWTLRNKKTNRVIK